MTKKEEERYKRLKCGFYWEGDNSRLVDKR